MLQAFYSRDGLGLNTVLPATMTTVRHVACSEYVPSTVHVGMPIMALVCTQTLVRGEYFGERLTEGRVRGVAGVPQGGRCHLRHKYVRLGMHDGHR